MGRALLNQVPMEAFFIFPEEVPETAGNMLTPSRTTETAEEGSRTLFTVDRNAGNTGSELPLPALSDVLTATSLQADHSLENLDEEIGCGGIPEASAVGHDISVDIDALDLYLDMRDGTQTTASERRAHVDTAEDSIASVREVSIDQPEHSRARLLSWCRRTALLARNLALEYDGPYKDLVRLQAHCLANQVEQLWAESPCRHEARAPVATRHSVSASASLGTASAAEPRDTLYRLPTNVVQGACDASASDSNTCSKQGTAARCKRKRRSFGGIHGYQARATKHRTRASTNEYASRILKQWLLDHFLNPYPGDEEKHQLMRRTGLTYNQLNNWFINARVRLWKPLVDALACKRQRQQEQPGT